MSALLSLGVGPFSSDTLTQECWPGSPGSPPVVTSLDSLTPHLKNPHILKKKERYQNTFADKQKDRRKKTKPTQVEADGGPQPGAMWPPGDIW